MAKPNNPDKHHSSAERTTLFGFATRRPGPDGRVEIALRWNRIGGALIALLLITWIGLSSLLFLHFKYNTEYSEASFSEVLKLLPSIPFGGLDEHRTKIGNFHIEKALKELEEGNFRDAFRLLRLGIARAPDNLKGRQILAEFYEKAINRPDVAADQLTEGLSLGGSDDLDYLKKTLSTLLRNQMDDKVQEIADEYLPKTPELNDRSRVLAFAAANANFLRGNFDRADDYIIDYGLIESLEGLLLSSRISWERGNQIAAITKLESSLRKFSNAEALLMQLSRYHRELGDFDEARRFAILRNISDPLSAAPRLELLYIHHETNDIERERAESRRMLRQFRDDESTLRALTNFAADTGNTDLARRTYEEALENEFSIAPFALLLVEAHLVKKDYQGSLRFSEELLKERPDWISDHWPIFNSLRAVASFGANRSDLGEIYLEDFLNGKVDNVGSYLAVARRFKECDQIEQARKVLLRAYESSPTNQKVLSELIRAELTLGNTENLNRLLSRLLQMRRPDPELLLDAYRKLGSDRFIFTQDRESLLIQLNAIIRENTVSQKSFPDSASG